MLQTGECNLFKILAIFVYFDKKWLEFIVAKKWEYSCQKSHFLSEELKTGQIRLKCYFC